DKLLKLIKEFQPFRDLWTTTSDWLRWYDSWMNDPLTTIDAEQVEKNVNESFKVVHKCVRQFKDIPGCAQVAQDIRGRIEEFKPYIPLIQALRNPGMRNRHWELLSEQIKVTVKPKANLTFAKCLQLKLQDHVEIIAKMAEIAGKEYSIEQALDKMEADWSDVLFDVMPYKQTGTFILKSPDDASQLLDDHIVMTQSMSFSPFKKEYEGRISTWEGKLLMLCGFQEVLEEWLQCQRSWLYLEPIFSSADINRQLPVESKRYQAMERLWRNIMKSANENRQVTFTLASVTENLRECNKLLELVQKGLSEYLETKRASFPRFYFLSDDELLEILSQTKDPTAVQPHLRKCFENIARLKFQEDLNITHMYSGEGEEVAFVKTIYPTGNVEDWLLNVERVMKASVKDNIERSLKIYNTIPRTEWVLSWPGQVVIAGCQINWTIEVSKALGVGKVASKLYPHLSTQLNDLVALVRGKLTRMQRAVLSALIVIEVHAKDVVSKLMDERVQSINDFEWISQLRYYWTRNDLYVCAVNAEFLYGYEYLGNSGRLVITPLTDRCYLTLTGALHLKFGGAPAGPAGTGKTETTKDLGKALAIQTVVFNCSDQLDFLAMGKFFKGLASSGAWACFDEFNRIDVEVLSVVAQQITTIQKAQQQRVDRFMFEGIEIALVASCAVFITMNPGYAGRTELPDNLKALFRPVAMMVPDYAMIAEISLYSFGFNNAKVLAKKITTTFKLSSEQLSSQDHYDFGMRAVKTVISAAGNLKRENPLMDEELICLRAICDVNVPKFLQDDLKLFNGIVSDLFPKIKEEPIDYGILEQSIRKTCLSKNLKDVDAFVTKCIQLYETTVVRHGLMLVGPSGSGKTKCYEVLAAAMTALKGQPSVSGGNYEAVNVFVLNPKSITMGQLYGEFDLLTHEWTDGILSCLIRAGAAATDQVKKWYMFDGPVDAVWIENMNTVLDDNKKLCLSSGEIMKLSEVMTMMFEVQDLAVASPATVSRCGMVYLEPSILGVRPFVECWLKAIPKVMKRYLDKLDSLFNRFLEVSTFSTLAACILQQNVSKYFTKQSCGELGQRGCHVPLVLQIQWVKWTKSSPSVTITPDTNYSDIIVPTQDTIRTSHVLMISPLPHPCSLMLQSDLVCSPYVLMINISVLRRKGVFGPPLSKYFIFFIDDLNMPALDTYGAQPPIEILRQWMDHGGWYDRKQIGSFKQLLDINFVCAMGPPGGGRNPITARFTRHFNYLSFTEMENSSKLKIFSTILGSWLGQLFGGLLKLQPLVNATIKVYSTITSQLLPTPAKSHYTFNLRDLSKVFQGMLMADSSKTQMMQTIQEYMEDFNQTSVTKMKLVLFMDAVQHICRISRILRQPMGNALLLGVGGSGRQSLTKLAAHMAEFECFQIELSKNYGPSEWREDVKGILMKAGIQSLQVTFLFVDTQIKSESFLEDINNILNSGDVPNLYAFDEQETIFTAMKPVVQDMGQQPTKANMMAAYTKHVRSNIHTVLCMSPIGEVFRARLRQFPALITCCTIDWFNEWPAEALESVANTFLEELPDLRAEEAVKMCVYIHQTVAIKSLQYLSELSRYNYITPKSYLDLLSLFSKLIGVKKQKLRTSKNRMKSGLDKVIILVNKLLCCALQVDTAIAEETRKSVSEEEAKAMEKANKAQAIADDAQKDLDEALPALDAALASLKSLNKNDVTEVSMSRPPVGVKLVIEAVCIMKGIKPKKVPGEKPGTKVDDYWEPGKGLLQDPAKFLDSLFKYDKDNIPDTVIRLIQPYIDNEDFMPAAIAKVSKACTSICQWVRAMHKYHFIAKAVEPKRVGTAGRTPGVGGGVRTKARLAGVEDGIAALEAKYLDCVSKKEELENKCEQCEHRLVRADKLINGLSDEKVRWQDTVRNLEYMVNNVSGDVLLAAGCVAYLGTFTVSNYRTTMTDDWLQNFIVFGVPHTKEPNLISTLADPVIIRSWQIAGLPNDSLSVENGVIAQYTQRWPLFIDPQAQANKWIKNLEKDNGLDIFKLSDHDFLRSLENSIRFGKPCLLENVREELDPALEPILLKQTYKQQGTTVIRLGDTVIPYHEDFKVYITTKLPNPHYTPEISTRVTLINFTLSPSGLEDQLLGRVVAQERPDLEEAKNQLIISNAKMKKELNDIEDQILNRLSSSEGNPVDDVELIKVLEASKVKAAEIKVAEQTEKDIDTTRLQYVPVAVRTQILFFCVSDLANVDPMYQYSLEWFLNIFMSGIANSEQADTVEKRIHLINEYFTFSLYCNVCRSLFEKHKLMFAFLMVSALLSPQEEWRFLLTGGSIEKTGPNPASSWLSQRAWREIQTLGNLQIFSDFPSEFQNNLQEFQFLFDSIEPHRMLLPGVLGSRLDAFQRLLVLRCLRADKVTNGMQDFVALNLGQKFIEPQASELSSMFKESGPAVPLVFVLSPGTDPAADLYKFAEEMKFSKKMSAISLGQGQGPRAEAMMHNSMERGKWVFFQNCHLSPSWMPSLERLIETIDSDKVHRDFRVWLTSLPSNRFPVSILQNGSKMTIEPPRGIKANLLKTYTSLSDDFLNSCTKTSNFKALLLSLCLFHGITLERRKFGPLGFNIPYEFTDGDLRICISQLKMFLEEYTELPYKVLKYTAGEINYGGRVTDDWDRRCIMNILEDFYTPDVLEENFSYSESGIYNFCVPQGYLNYMKSLPINDTPEMFGLHENANITFAQNETFSLLNTILQLQPKASTSSGKSHDEVVEEVAVNILEKLPSLIDIQAVVARYPVMYEESMNTVLIQEVIRYNRLVDCIVKSLDDLLKALKGLVVMSSQLELMSNSLYNNSVPEFWNSKAYPSLKPLSSWVLDLLERIKFIQLWINAGIPPVFWISGFFFPQAFLTGTLQNFARRSVVSIDTISFDFNKLKKRPSMGCYIHGLFLEGARWDSAQAELSESRPKELYTEMAVIWLLPVANRKAPQTGIYICPIYKTLTRAGTLSTTGHSTNYVIAVELPTSQLQRHWIKQGVALICALDY
uniref:Dynein axonemal heavy chain 1 n=1 Tax=Callorhinchus milii TaxID=7868 RepID=A0A4W3IJM0_CALMI